MSQATKYVYLFEDTSNQDLEMEDGKSARCAKLLQQYRLDGFEPAPNGFRIIASAYRKHLVENNLVDKLREVLRKFEESEIDLKTAEAECNALIMNAHMPVDVKTQIIENNQQLEEAYGATFKRIARSDFTIGEDEEGEAGAGRHESEKGIRSQTDLLYNVKKVWASAFTDKAISAFRGRRCPTTGEYLHLIGDMRVPVMREIDSENGGSFIVFTNFLNTAFITFLKKEHGDKLVSGDVTPAVIIANLSLLDQGVNPILNFDIPDGDLGLSYEDLIKYLHRINRRHKEKGPIDNEAAMDDGQIYTVQERPNTPHIKKANGKQIEIHSINSHPEEGRIGNGESVADLCANGIALNLESDMINTLDSQNFKGKILIYETAEPQLSILATMEEDRRPAGLITRQGTKICHMGINIDDNIPCIVGVTDLTPINDGEEISILGDKVYTGCHPFIVEYLDLEELPEIKGKSKPKLVACNPSKVEKYMILPHHGYALVRHEGLQQATIVNGKPLPPILSCLHFDKVRDNELTKSIINLMMVPSDLGFSFGSPIDAYIYYMTRALVPLLEDASRKSAMVDLRAYGGRLVEDDPMLEKGFIQEEAYDSIGCDGALMYLQPWGRGVLEAYCKIWKNVWDMGYENMPIFIPNVANLQEWLLVKQIIEDCGIPIDRKKRFGNYKVKIMLENVSAIFSTNEFYKHGVDEGSLGFNDLRQSLYLYKRDMAFIKTRGDADSAQFLQLMNILFDTKPDEFKIHTCGVPSPKLIELLIRRGVDSLGLAPGKKFFEGVKLISKIETAM